MATARKYASTAPASEPVTETPVQPTVKPSIWQRIKRTAKAATNKVVVFAKTVGRKTVAASKFVGRKLRQNWGLALAAVITAVALVVAPLPTLIAVPLVWIGYQMMSSDSALVRFFGDVYAQIGIQIFVDGLIAGFANRR